MFRSRRRDGGRARAGNAAFTAVSVLCLLGFGALVVDIGHARKTRAELQNAVDAAAHAAVLEIDFTEAGLEAARAAAVSIGQLNLADGDPVALADADIVFGIHDGDAFTPSEDASVVNAVTVAHQKLDVQTIFGLAAFGRETLGAGASALAMIPPPTPASEVSCYLPIAVPKCAIYAEGIYDFQASSNPNDSAGWAALPGEDGTRPNADFLKKQLSGEECAGAMMGETAEAMNGSAAAATSTALRRINFGDDGEGPFRAAGNEYQPPAAWPTEHWPVQPDASERVTGSGVDSSVFGGYGIAGPLLLVSRDADNDGEDDFCDDDDGDGEPDNLPNWTGTMTLEGFAFGMIYDGRATGSDAVLRIRVNTEYEFDDYATDGGGTVDYGLVFNEPVRVLPTP
jgi:hypothetical protein